MAVYLLHSTVPLVLPNGREVRHYLGWTGEGNFPRRLKAHLSNHKSARIVQAFLANGGELCLGNYWPGRTPQDERQMKRNGHLEAKCLVCERNQIAHQLYLIRTLAEAPSPPGDAPS
jgi:hypothetical protein